MILALEPEAASLLARQEFERQMNKSLPVGTQYMVLDCGGGTIDVTVHETLTEMPLAGSAALASSAAATAEEKVVPAVREIYKASGGKWGSTYVDAAFEDVLNGIFNAPNLVEYREKFPSEWLKLMNAFVSLKEFVNADPNNKEFGRVAVPRSFEKFISKANGGELDELVQEYVDATVADRDKLFRSLGLHEEPDDDAHEDQDIKAIRYDGDNGELVMSQAFLRSLMLPQINSTIDHARSLLEKHPGVGYVFLVGGFSECPLLRERVKEVLSRAASANLSARQVICPPNAGLSVLKGAVLYGVRPQVVTHRIMRKTYGVQCNDIW
jgi:hypothetical protein